MEKEIFFTINVVSKQTGLSQFVIRAWENRYNAVVPNRTDTNRRVYSESDIEKLKLLKNLTESGFNISNIANLEIPELQNLITKGITGSVNESKFSADTKTIEACMNAIKNYNGSDLYQILQRASIEFTNLELINEILLPLIYEIGENWHQGKLKIAQEHLATAVIQNFLKNLINIYRPKRISPKLVTAAPKGQQHELGALIVSLVAASEGWNLIYLGSDLPINEISETVNNSDSDVLALSIVYPAYDFVLFNELTKLKEKLNKKVKIIFGGKAAHSYTDAAKEINATIITDLNDFRNKLRSIEKEISKEDKF